MKLVSRELATDGAVAKNMSVAKSFLSIAIGGGNLNLPSADFEVISDGKNRR